MQGFGGVCAAWRRLAVRVSKLAVKKLAVAAFLLADWGCRLLISGQRGYLQQCNPFWSRAAKFSAFSRPNCAILLHFKPF